MEYHHVTYDSQIHLILDHEGAILEARRERNEWAFSVRFGSGGHFTEFVEHFEPHGNMELKQMMKAQTPGGVQYGVTEKQREALLAAYDAGYYGDSRTATGADLAEQFDITQQALSKR